MICPLPHVTKLVRIILVDGDKYRKIKNKKKLYYGLTLNLTWQYGEILEWSGTNYFVDEGDGECYGDDVVRGGL